jgi:hypothetical protein
MSPAFQELVSLPHLLLAFDRAAAGKRSKPDVAAFEFRLLDNLFELRASLIAGTYRPGPYRHFFVHEPKRRKVSAAAFRDLGFVVYPEHRLVKARKVRYATRRLSRRYRRYREGCIDQVAFNASVQGWINHVRCADSWGLRQHVLAAYRLELPRGNSTTCV